MKTSSHPDALAVLQDAAAGRRSPLEGRDAVYRLLAASDGRSPEPATAPAADELERAADAALAALPARLRARDAERATARATAERLEEIGRVSPAEARSRAAALAAEQRRSTVEALVRRTDELSLDEPAQAIVLAGVAVAAAEAGRPEATDVRRNDLRAAARRALAEAAYRGGDLIAAEGTLSEATRLAGLGTLDRLLRAELLRLEAEIRSDQSRFAEACRLARRSIRLLRSAGESRLEARGRISLAVKLAYDGRLDEALAENARALAAIDAERDGRWVLAAEFNQAFWLNDAGDAMSARDALPRLEELVRSHGRALDRVRLDWLAARIAAQQGDLVRAAELYRPVLERCLELETIYDSATVALELAVVLLELGRADEVLPLADTVAPIFRAQGVEPEAAAAVLLAAESLRQGVATREVLRSLLAARAGARNGR